MGMKAGATCLRTLTEYQENREEVFAVGDETTEHQDVALVATEASDDVVEMAPEPRNGEGSL
jgi:hypothetical protein